MHSPRLTFTTLLAGLKLHRRFIGNTISLISPKVPKISFTWSSVTFRVNLRILILCLGSTGTGVRARLLLRLLCRGDLLLDRFRRGENERLARGLQDLLRERDLPPRAGLLNGRYGDRERERDEYDAERDSEGDTDIGRPRVRYGEGDCDGIMQKF